MQEGSARFPLSLAHYIETWRHSNEARRRRLAQTMSELSRHVSIASPPALCNNELGAFLDRRFELRVPPPQFHVFGRGLAHADGRRSSNVDLDAGRELLARRPDDFMEPGLPGRGKHDYANAYAAGEQGLADGIAERGNFSYGLEDHLAASAVMEIWENIQLAMVRAGLPPQALLPISLVRPDLPDHAVRVVVPALLDVAREFIAELPTRDAALQLRVMRHRNPQKRWHPNDLNDVAYLACAVVHCDVIVTERHWVHELTRSVLLEQHATIALHDVRELPDALADAAASRSATSS